MKSYIGSKLVTAYPQTNVEFKFNHPERDQPGPENETKGYTVDYGNYISWCPEDEFERIARPINIYERNIIVNRWLMTRIINAEPATAITAGNAPEEEGYNIYYPDGHLSWSPKEAFEVAYREITEEEKDLMDITPVKKIAYPKLDEAIKEANEAPDSTNVLKDMPDMPNVEKEFSEKPDFTPDYVNMDLPEEGEGEPYTLKPEFKDVDGATDDTVQPPPPNEMKEQIKKRTYKRLKKTEKPK